MQKRKNLIRWKKIENQKQTWEGVFSWCGEIAQQESWRRRSRLWKQMRLEDASIVEWLFWLLLALPNQQPIESYNFKNWFSITANCWYFQSNLKKGPITKWLLLKLEWLFLFGECKYLKKALIGLVKGSSLVSNRFQSFTSILSFSHAKGFLLRFRKLPFEMAKGVARSSS